MANYTRGKLSFVKDRLPAVSGLASVVQQRTSTQRLAILGSHLSPSSLLKSIPRTAKLTKSGKEGRWDVRTSSGRCHRGIGGSFDEKMFSLGLVPGLEDLESMKFSAIELGVFDSGGRGHNGRECGLLLPTDNGRFRRVDLLNSSRCLIATGD
ncbi:uncharacterized protein PV07_00330 [Cladophialophora immunda]|uniref:Uncharacterized protein n=1 Tax=Cladophialophora immunda TaxID=569365 RepID=A0A0D2DCR5_9EURO|nr:uncharacterized protein PV07_00330 [Cladophialophora immunda]KIW33484.1 hypothetical protein PV07_00330 [Cladophialophora immunda]